MQHADVIKFILQNATNDELNAIVQAVQMRRTQLARRMTFTLRAGAIVSFTDRSGVTVTGKVEKVNRKNVVVNTGGLQKWRVPANMLKVTG